MTEEMSDKQKDYFNTINNELNKAYGLAQKARATGYDVEDVISIPLAKNMAERIVGLISVVAPQVQNCGIVERIMELEKKYGLQDWRVAYILAEDVAKQKYCKFETECEAIEVALRLGLAYITNGVVSSPLEGFIRLELKDRNDAKGKFFSLYFGGPIRSAGTTATCIFIGCCDYVRIKMGYAEYDPTENEIKRVYSELEYFHNRITNLQYFPSEKEVEFLARHLPLQIDGDPSEKIEVPNYKDLPRVKTNKLRNGFCLVYAEGLCQKFKKFWGKFSKWNEEFEMSKWSFLNDFVKLQEEVKAGGKKTEVKIESGSNKKIAPDYTFVKDLVAGRPIFAYPLRSGGFRLRYGRTRTSGFSVDAISPATMVVLDGFVASATQLKPERPKKGNTITVCEYIEGPRVKLKDGSVKFLETFEEASNVNKDVVEILYMGDLLVNYGDFLDRAHTLVPPGYCEEWWAKQLEKNSNNEFSDLIKDPLKNKVSCKEAIEISLKYNVPLHPRYTFFWNEVSIDDIKKLLNWVNLASIKEDKVIFPYQDENEKQKRVLELIGLPHTFVSNEYVVVEKDWSDALKCSLGFYSKKFNLDFILTTLNDEGTSLILINSISEVTIKDKSGIFIGARMGRPEKGKMRKLTGTPHVLFPVSEEGGRLRSFQSTLEAGFIEAQFPLFYCDECLKETIYAKCHRCGNKSRQQYDCRTCGIIDNDNCEHENILTYNKRRINIREYFDHALKKLGMRSYPELIKGVRGTSNKEHLPEHLVKGLLRAKHNVYVNKDGTTRFDMTEMTMTHFKPKEIGTSIEKLIELGYDLDIYGNSLKNEDQVLELKCQDIVLPSCPDSLEEGADIVLFRVANFIDDLLEKFYGLERYYNLEKPRDIVGQLVIGMSPHTAAGIVARIIGFSKVQGLWAHPYLHSFMRRDCDGDEACVMLMLDAFLNFSRKLLSDHRGATQDEPLVLTSNIIPAEVDDMIFNMDIVWNYPLEFYEACEQYKKPWDIKMKTVLNTLGTPAQFEGFGFTHETQDVNAGVLCSNYKILPTMQEKVSRQMELAEKLRSVNVEDVATLVIERHFIRDIKGNLGKFSRQVFRCVKCNEKYRRPPLKGICTSCNGKIIFTIHEGSIVKYLEPSLSLAAKYKLPPYLVQTLELTKQRIEDVFGKDKDKQENLGRWFG